MQALEHLHHRRERVSRVTAPIQRFIQLESASGIALLFGAAIALAWANSPWAPSYRDLLQHHIAVDLGIWRRAEPLHFWIDDGLMTLFFFIVGLEIRRELSVGELSERRRLAVPVAGAIGGMMAPALIFTAVVRGGAGAHGWAIPVATDIAFALGVLALAGGRVPHSLRLLLLALAIVDDIGGIAIIAIFYTEQIDVAALAGAGTVLMVCLLLRQGGVWHLPIYWVLGAVGWAFMLESGIHPTIFGVALGLLAPWRGWHAPSGLAHRMDELTRRFHEAERSHDRDYAETEEVSIALEMARTAQEHIAPLDRLIRDLQPVVAFGIAPLFAFANAGIAIDADTLRTAATAPLTLGIALGFIIGKPLGILLAIRVAVAAGARLPAGIGWAAIGAVGMVAAVGFTVALFIAGLSFDDEELLTQAKLGIIAASVIAGFLGWSALRRAFPALPRPRD